MQVMIHFEALKLGVQTRAREEEQAKVRAQVDTLLDKLALYDAANGAFQNFMDAVIAVHNQNDLPGVLVELYQSFFLATTAIAHLMPPDADDDEFLEEFGSLTDGDSTVSLSRRLSDSTPHHRAESIRQAKELERTQSTSSESLSGRELMAKMFEGALVSHPATKAATELQTEKRKRKQEKEVDWERRKQEKRDKKRARKEEVEAPAEEMEVEGDDFTGIFPARKPRRGPATMKTD